eukprot:367793_1
MHIYGASGYHKIVASDGATGFGLSVSIYDQFAIVGAIGDDGQGPNSGSAYIYTLDSVNSIWIETHKLVASNGGENHRFGFALSIDSERAIVGTWVDFQGIHA